MAHLEIEIFDRSVWGGGGGGGGGGREEKRGRIMNYPNNKEAMSVLSVCELLASWTNFDETLYECSL